MRQCHKTRPGPLVAAVVCACMLGISSCASLPRIPSSPFRLAGLDTSALRGKVIVLDPGHGGRFGGAVGDQGLKESEVNLGVALYLWGLLSSAGARPIMTRTADTAVTRAQGDHLSNDLTARSNLSNSIPADLFISIHHNSDIHDPRKNDLAVYYKLSEPGASRELAESVMRRLTEVVGADNARTVPGNFGVLRKTVATAILGEASYLTHRENERRLNLHAFLKMEAEAYFAGILDYCNRGIPSVTAIVPDGVVIDDARPEVVARVADDGYGKGIDPSSIRLYLDGVEADHVYEPSTGSVRSVPVEPLANGEHTLRVEAKNNAGNSARPGRAVFRVSCPPATIEGHVLPAIIPPDGASRCRITARVLDAHGNPVADGTLVSFFASAGLMVEPAVETRGGYATTHLVAGTEPADAQVLVRCGSVSASYGVSFALPEQHVMEIAVLDSLGAPVERAEVLCGKERCCMTDRLGYCFLQIDGGKKIDFTVWKDGYVPLQGVLEAGEEAGRKKEVVISAVDDGLLWNRVIMLDPRGGQEGERSDAFHEREGFEDNLAVALYAEEMLKLAGARVVLTRRDDAPLTAAEKVLRSDEVRADLVISISRAAQPAVGYYFNSAKGRMFARSLSQFMAGGFSCRQVEPAESTDFLIVHTSMPAVTVSFGPRGCKKMVSDTEARLWKEAQVLFQAVRSYFIATSRGASAGDRNKRVN